MTEDIEQANVEEMPDHEHDATERVGQLVVHEDDHPDPEERSIWLRIFPQSDGKARKAAGPCAVPGVSLTNYNVGPSGKGWGEHCTGNRTTIKLTNGTSGTCRTEIAELSTLIMNECLRRGYNIRDNDTGCYNCRYISGTTVWSNHAWALAWDINWQSNPYTSGTTHDIPDWMAKLFNRYGFAWGGDYTGGSRDYMHFEFMGTPAQAATATNLARSELSGVRPPADPNDEILTFGDTGPAVLVLQQTLNRWYPKLTPLAENSTFDLPTEDRVKYYQTAANLTPVDGEVGPATRAGLGLKAPSEYNTPTPPPPPPPDFVPGGAIKYVYDHLPQALRDALGKVIRPERQVDNGGSLVEFEGLNGHLYWSAATGAKLIQGAILVAYGQTDWERGPLGFPTSHEFSYEDLDQDGNPKTFLQSNFQHGHIVWDPVALTATVYT